MVLKYLKYKIIGRPLPTEEYGKRQLNKIRALAAFSPDALSSIAYANQEIFLGLIVAGAAGLSMSFTIGLAIVAILLILTLSYSQTIHVYPSGGGSWIVSQKNLGKHVGLVAAAALLMDYLLVASVSLTAGVEAISSAFPSLWPHRVLISLLLLAGITIINLRGTQEAGTAMSLPVYFFLFTYIPMLAYGVLRALIEGPGDLALIVPPVVEPLTLVLLLHAFASGCTALTGVEAISNGVPAFESPKSRNASTTLFIMSALMIILFLGSIGLTQYLAVLPGPNETILSALARRILGDGPLYVLVQASTLLILAVAANTSFADFPRVAALLAQDSYVARHLANLGDRLVFANGVLLLAGAAALLIVMFDGVTHALVPLFAIGAFLAFTLSQTGMVVYWWRVRSEQWFIKALINGLGALITASALCIIGVSKFVDGAWITFLLIPALVYVFMRIHKHYEYFDLHMSPSSIPPAMPKKYVASFQQAVIPVSRINRGTAVTIAFAKKIAKKIVGVNVEIVEGEGKKLLEQWNSIWPGIPLYIINTPYRSVTQPLLKFLDDIDEKYGDGKSTVVLLPVFFTARWWQTLLHNQTSWQIMQAIINSHNPNRTIIQVPYLLKR